MSKPPNVHTEIARLESELKRLAFELDTLRQRVEGTSGPRRTKAFTAPPPPISSAPSVSSDPVPSRAPTSQTVPTSSGRNYARDLGLDAEPAPRTPTPTRRQAAGDDETGRYKFVGEPRTQRSTNRR